jgi:hypothetical protein
MIELAEEHGGGFDIRLQLQYNYVIHKFLKYNFIMFILFISYIDHFKTSL